MRNAQKNDNQRMSIPKPCLSLNDNVKHDHAASSNLIQIFLKKKLAPTELVVAVFHSLIIWWIDSIYYSHLPSFGQNQPTNHSSPSQNSSLIYALAALINYRHPCLKPSEPTFPTKLISINKKRRKREEEGSAS